MIGIVTLLITICIFSYTFYLFCVALDNEFCEEVKANNEPLLTETPSPLSMVGFAQQIENDMYGPKDTASSVEEPILQWDPYTYSIGPIYRETMQPKKKSKKPKPKKKIKKSKKQK